MRVAIGESAFRLTLPKPGRKPDVELEDEVAIDFSIPRRCVYRRFAGRPGPCPNCGRTLHQHVQTYLVATRQGREMMDALFVSNDMGWFCADCPTVVINTHEMDVALAHPMSGWDLGDEIAVVGIVDLDAVPPEQAHLPLDEIDPLPLIPFDVAPGGKSPARSARSARKKRPKRVKPRRKPKKGKRRRP